MSWPGPPSSPFGQPPDVPPSSPVTPVTGQVDRPPAMPVAGWYTDPERAATWRYWDGLRWTEHVAPMHVAVARDPYSFAAWFEDSTAVVKTVLRRVAVALLVVYLLAFGGFLLVLVGAWGSETGRELRRLLELDEVFRPGGGSVELTDAEADRAADLFGDLVGQWWVPTLLVLLVVVLVSVWAVALTAAASWEAVDTDDTTRHASIIGRPSPWSTATRRLPAVLASGFCVVLVVVAVMTLPLLPLVAAVAADASGEVIALTAVIGGVTAVILAFFTGVRLAVAVVLAARGGHGLGIGRSWELTGDRFWGTVGRLAIAGLLASLVSAPFGFFNGFGFSFGFWFAVIVVLLGQALSAAASVLVQIPAQVVLATHLTEQREEQREDERAGGTPSTSGVQRGPLG